LDQKAKFFTVFGPIFVRKPEIFFLVRGGNGRFFRFGL